MSTKWCFQLNLLHGRHDPNETLNDCGFEGLTLACIEAVHVTYSATFTVWFVNQEAPEDMLVTNDQNGMRSYFGDWGFQVPEPQSPAPPT